MKKHLFGLAIFSFIVTSFAVAFAFFYAPPIPQVAEVKVNYGDYGAEKSMVGYGKTSCFRNSRKQLSSEVISSHYLADENKIISKIKLVWNGAGAPPKIIHSTTMFSTSENRNEDSFAVVEILEKPFQYSTEQTVTIVKEVSDTTMKERDNLYVVSSVFNYTDGENGSLNIVFSERKAVLTIHGN